MSKDVLTQNGRRFPWNSIFHDDMLQCNLENTNSRLHYVIESYRSNPDCLEDTKP